MEGHFAEGDVSFVPRVVHAKPPRRVEGGGSWESVSSHKEVIKEVLISSIEAGPINQSLSRTSSSGSAPGSATGPDVSSVGSPIERYCLDYGSWNPTGASLNFQQAEEDFQLQLALALRVAAEAAAVDDPDLSEKYRSRKGNAKSRMPGITKTEATAYRYWVSNCLSYDDRIEDGFYEIWGMSPYVWSMCTDSSELGRMPPLKNLRAVTPHEDSFEVVLVDRNMDPSLRELEDKAIGLAYDSTEVLDMASKLSIMVANVMGGAVSSDEMLLEDWRISSNKLAQLMSSIVLPIGVLRVGLSRHRALLFKVMADSVGLPCRLLRGSLAYSAEDSASVVVKCGDDKEWMVDLLANPGTIMPPDKRLATPQLAISSPLKFERQGSSVSVLHWTRGEPTGMDGGGNRDESPQRRIFPGNTDYSPRAFDGGGRNQKGLEFYRFDGAKVANNKPRGSSDDGSKELYGLVNLLDRPGLRSQEIAKGNLFLDNTSSVVVDAQRAEGGQGHERDWEKVDRRVAGPEDYANCGNAGTMLGKLSLTHSDFEIAWEDLVVGERIGQGSYGKVNRADWQGSDVAVKVFLDQDLKTEALEEFKREVAIMSRLRHPNIVLFMGAVTKPPNLSIITEFCPRGSLFRLLHRPNRELDERKRIRMAVDVAKGMNYLHRCSPPVVHRDLKSPNLLVDKNWTVKVCDFGLSRQKHNTFLSSKSSAGTPEWMAPEVLRNEPSDEKSDVYSFGVILWELATLEVPWNGMNTIQVVGAVGFQHRRLPIPEHVDRAIAAIIQACWRTDSKLRPSFADLMQDLRNLQHRTP